METLSVLKCCFSTWLQFLFSWHISSRVLSLLDFNFWSHQYPWEVMHRLTNAFRCIWSEIIVADEDGVVLMYSPTVPLFMFLGVTSTSFVLSSIVSTVCVLIKVKDFNWVDLISPSCFCNHRFVSLKMTSLITLLCYFQDRTINRPLCKVLF